MNYLHNRLSVISPNNYKILILQEEHWNEQNLKLWILVEAETGRAIIDIFMVVRSTPEYIIGSEKGRITNKKKQKNYYWYFYGSSFCAWIYYWLWKGPNYKQKKKQKKLSE